MMTEYTQVEFDEERPEDPRFIMRTGVDDDGLEWIHEVPLRAVADRMELLGLDTPEEALEAITRIAQNPELGDEIYSSLNTAYGEVARAEARAVIAADGKVTRQSSGAQTVLAVGLVAAQTRDLLDQARADALRKLGMRGAAAEQRASASKTSEEEARWTLRPSAAVAARVSEIVRARPQQVEEFRMMTAVSYAEKLGTVEGDDS